MYIKLYMCGGEKPVSQFTLGLGYLKTNCESDTVKIDIVSSRDELKDCDMIGLSSAAWGIREAVDILNSTKIPVVIGGQATLWDKLKDYPFTHIVIGEGETALKNVIAGGAPRIIKASLIKDIDTLKYPERGDCGLSVPMLTSRGCPYDCHFCSSQEFWETVRFHTPEYIVNEVKYIQKRYPHAKELYILDDLFAVSKTRLKKVFDLWQKNAFHMKYMLKGFVRSNVFDVEMGKMLKAMRFQRIRFGAESGSDRILKLLNKRATVADHQRTIDVANSIGLPVTASFMHGIPGETEEDRALTAAFIKKNEGKLGIEGYYKFKSFPGTKFYAGEDPMAQDMRVR